MQTDIDLRNSASYVLVQFVQPWRKMFEIFVFLKDASITRSFCIRYRLQTIFRNSKLPIQKQWENNMEHQVIDLKTRNSLQAS